MNHKTNAVKKQDLNSKKAEKTNIFLEKRKKDCVKIPFQLLNNHKYNKKDLLAYACIASSDFDFQGKCFKSNKRFSEECGINVRNFFNHAKKLIEGNFISRDKIKTKTLHSRIIPQPFVDGEYPSFISFEILENELLNKTAVIFYDQVSQFYHNPKFGSFDAFFSVKYFCEKFDVTQRQAYRAINQLKSENLIKQECVDGRLVWRIPGLDLRPIQIPLEIKEFTVRDMVELPPETYLGSKILDPKEKEKKYIKKENFFHKQFANAKSLSLSVANMLANNPHNITEEELERWKSRFEKPIKQRYWIRVNEELNKIAQNGYCPRQAFQAMLEKGWKKLIAEKYHAGIKPKQEITLVRGQSADIIEFKGTVEKDNACKECGIYLHRMAGNICRTCEKDMHDFENKSLLFKNLEKLSDFTEKKSASVTLLFGQKNIEARSQPISVQESFPKLSLSPNLGSFLQEIENLHQKEMTCNEHEQNTKKPMTIPLNSFTKIKI